MNRMDAITWVMRVCGALRLSQSTTLSQLAFHQQHARRGQRGQAGGRRSSVPTQTEKAPADRLRLDRVASFTR